MEGELGPDSVPIGLLEVHSSCFPQQLRHFLETSASGEPREARTDATESIPFYVLPERGNSAVLEQGLISHPALWVDDQEAATGTAALYFSYSLGSSLQTQQLPIKPIKLQPIRNGADTTASYRAFVTSKVHLQLYRLVSTLFPTLERWDADLRSNIHVVMSSSTETAAQPRGDQPATSVDQIRAKSTENGLLLELHSPQTGITARGRIVINFRLACLELQTIDAPTTVLENSGGGSSGSLPPPASSPAKCLRTLHSLEEAVTALQVKSSEQPLASPSSSPSKYSTTTNPDGTTSTSSSNNNNNNNNNFRTMLSFQSPPKPPRRASRVFDLVHEGVALVQACSSAQLREGATMLQTAAASPDGAAAGIEAGAMEALVAAGCTVLPSAIMGTTEQLTLLTLTAAALLDGCAAEKRLSARQGAIRLVAALSQSLLTACANPVLLCKVSLALLQRPDVRLEAINQNLWSVICATYLRKSPLLEPLAAALLSPSAVSTAGKQQQNQSSPSSSSSSSPPPQVADGEIGSATSRSMSTAIQLQGKLSVPRLCLPSEPDYSQASTSTGGLTRATRRESSTTPTEWHPPSAPWDNPRRISANKETTAFSEMEVLAEALGESLMAMDLPSAVAHKRRADLVVVRDSESDVQNTIPAELLEGPLITARQQTLQAHAIFTTARSLRSLESSTVLSGASIDTIGKGRDRSLDINSPGRNYFSVAVADVSEVKTLLLQSMMAAFPLPLPSMPRHQRAFNSLEAEEEEEAEKGEEEEAQHTPAPILAAEVLSMPLTGLTSHQDTLRASCLQFLARLALREEGNTTSGAPQHVFLAAVGTKLSQTLSGGAHTSSSAAAHAAHLMQVAAEYVSLVETPSAAVAAAQHCLGPICLALTALQAAGSTPDRWEAASWRLLDGVLILLTPVMTHCSDAESGRSFISTLLGDYKVAAMLVAVAERVLLCSEDEIAAHLSGKIHFPPLQRDLLAFFTALAGLLARQPPLSVAAGGFMSPTSSPTDDDGSGGSASLGLPSMSSSSSSPPSSPSSSDPGNDVLVIVLHQASGRGQQPRRLIRRQALNFFAFLVSPTSDFVRRVLDHGGSTSTNSNTTTTAAGDYSEASSSSTGGGGGGGNVPPAPPSTSAVRLRPGLFELLKTVFSAPGSPYIADKAIADHYVRFHFIQFLKLYHNPHRDHQAPFLCRQHMAALLSLAGTAAPHVRHRFQQLSVIDFFVRELSLEFEASKPGGGRLGAADGGSAADLLSAGRTASLGKLQASTAFKKKGSPAGSAREGSPALAQINHKRTRSQSGIPLLPLSSRKEEPTSPWTTPSPSVPKLRLPGSAPRSGDSAQHTPSTENPQRGAATLHQQQSAAAAASSRRGSPRGTSRLGREAAAVAVQREQQQQYAAATDAGSTIGVQRPSLMIPPLALLNPRGFSSPPGADASPSPSPQSSGAPPVASLMLSSSSGDDDDDVYEDRISTVTSIQVPPLQLQRRQSPTSSGVAAGGGGAGGGGQSSRALDRSISAAISLDKGWMPSARTAAAAAAAGGGGGGESSGGAAVSQKKVSISEETSVVLPSGFVFTGDLDEDVERLEALEREGEEDSDDYSTSSSDDEAQSAPPSPSPPRRPSFNLGLNLTGVAAPPHQPPAVLLEDEESSGDESEDSTTNRRRPVLPRAVPRLRVPLPNSNTTSATFGSNGGGGGDDTQLPDSPPPRPIPPPVPLLAITASMHSTLEARMASAELQVAVEAERFRRKAGRSFFGDLERSALGKGKMQAATLARRSTLHRPSATEGLSLGGYSTPGSATDGSGIFTNAPGSIVGGGNGGGGGGYDSLISYAEEHSRRLVYRDPELHLQILVLVFTLIMDPRGQLDPAYCDQYPWERKLQNIPFILHHHLNHPENRDLLPRLLPALHALGSPAMRLLRTLCAAFFRPEWYSRRARISGVAGAYATVYRCALPSWAGESTVVLKLLDTPKHIQDRCAQVDFHSEVTILDILAGRPASCQMFDFGLDPRADALLLVLKDYRCSLKQWRAAQPEDPAAQLRLYYSVYREVVVAVGQLLDSGVIHFDLKCDNILLEPLPGRSEAEFWAPPSSTPPFRVVLADFGESKLADRRWGGGGGGGGGDASSITASATAVAASAAAAAAAAAGATTSRARGTDAFKSPEMLLVGGAVQKGHRAYDRRRRQGAGAASDVWSLGCLLFELVTGRLLFSDTDWLQLVARVTSTNMQLITDERATAVAELPGVLDLLQYILVRDPALRPTLKDTLAKLDTALALYGHSMPQHRPGAAPPAHLMEAHAAAAAAAALPLTGYRGIAAEEPLPLLSALPLSPGLLVGPATSVSRSSLREAAVGHVLLISHHHHHHHHRLSSGHTGVVSAADILADEVLSECLEAAAGVGASCEVICGPVEDGVDAGELLRWVESTLPRVLLLPPHHQHHHQQQQQQRSVLLAAQSGREGAAVLLAVVHAMRAEGCTAYRAMVRASHWGLDLHLTGVHFEALRLLGERERNTV